MTLADYLPVDNQQQPPERPQDNLLIWYQWQVATVVPSWLSQVDFMWHLKLFLVTTRGDYIIKDKYINEDGTANRERIAKELTIMYAANRYMLNGLYETTQLEYNPIQNYDMVEDSQVQNSGVDKDVTSYGGTTRTDNYGARTTTGSNTFGQQQNVNTDRVSPDNNETYYARSQQQTNIGSHTDSVQSTTQGTIDTSTTQSHTDDNTFTHGHIITNHLERSGNIGVTTTQQMIMSQREVVKDLNIYEVLADMIVHQICVSVWSV